MKVFRLQHEDDLSELEYLEKIYKQVRLEELVKFNGKAYIRSTPKNNKYYKYPYHFHILVKDIYSGSEETLRYCVEQDLEDAGLNVIDVSVME